MTIPLGSVLIRTAAHGDVVVVFDSDTAARVARDRPDAAQFTPEGIEGLQLISESPDALGRVLQVCRWLPGAIVTQIRREMPAAEAA